MIEPSNLSEQARTDLKAIIDKSFDQFGETQARVTETRILNRCRLIQDRHSLGHKIDSIKTKRTTLYHYEHPWMIAFDPVSREVIRVIHAKRELARILGRR